MTDEEKDALIRELVKALDASLIQMEDDLLRIEGEWGSGRTIDQLLDAGELPDAFRMGLAVMVAACFMGYRPPPRQG